jgi:hypothetical protein
MKTSLKEHSKNGNHRTVYSSLMSFKTNIQMKKIKYISAVLFASLVIGVTMPGCLKLQKDFKRSTTDTLNAHLNMTAWAYLKSRAYNNTIKSDTLFRSMYTAIIYSGIDTNEYIKPGRTFIFLNIASCKLVWADVYTSANKAGTSWKSYPAADVKNYLEYLILTKEYSHYNLPTTDVIANTLLPAGAYTTTPVNFQFHTPALISNPNSTMNIRVQDSSPSNTSDYPITLNGTIYVNTSDLLATNGVVDVMAAFVSPNPPAQ